VEAGIGAGVGFGAGLGFGVGSVEGRGLTGVPSSLILELEESGLAGFSDLALAGVGKEEERGVTVVSRIFGVGRLGTGVEVGVVGLEDVWTAAFSLAKRRRRRFCSISSFFCSSSIRSEG